MLNHYNYKIHSVPNPKWYLSHCMCLVRIGKMGIEKVIFNFDIPINTVFVLTFNPLDFLGVSLFLFTRSTIKS